MTISIFYLVSTNPNSGLGQAALPKESLGNLREARARRRESHLRLSCETMQLDHEPFLVTFLSDRTYCYPDISSNHPRRRLRNCASSIRSDDSDNLELDTLLCHRG
jgi:hypothetical protein